MKRGGIEYPDSKGTPARSERSKRQEQVPAHDLAPHSPGRGKGRRIPHVNRAPDEVFLWQGVEKSPLHGGGEALTAEARL